MIVIVIIIVGNLIKSRNFRLSSNNDNHSNENCRQSNNVQKPYGQLLVICFVFDYYYMGSETDFTQESHFHFTARIPNSFLLHAAVLSQNSKIAV